MDIFELVTEIATKFYKDGKLDILFVVGAGGVMVRIAVAQVRKVVERLDAKDVADTARDKDLEYLRRDVDRIDEDCSGGGGKLNSKRN
jgi:hypothetical protein